MKKCVMFLLVFHCAFLFAEPIPYSPTAVPQAILGKGAPPQGKDLKYYSENPRTVGYLAEPTGNSSRGAVILVHEWGGLVGRIRQTADAFAADGYVALAVDLYSGTISNQLSISLNKTVRVIR